MTAIAQNRTNPLSADFVPVIADHSLSVFVGQIREAHAADAVNGDVHVHAGTLLVQVLENLHQEAPHAGSAIQIPFHQIADPMVRIRNGSDQWNRLDLTSGKLLLLACASPDGGRSWQAVAAINVTSPQDPNAVAVKQAYEVEAAPGLGKYLLLDKALQNPQPILLAYALNALGERNVLGRHDAVRLLIGVMQHKDASPSDRKEVAGTLIDVFHAPGQDAPDQKLILAALASALLSETDHEERTALAFGLRTCVLADDGAHSTYIAAVIRAVTAPPPELVIHALTAVQHDAVNVPDPEDRQSIAQLIHVWQKSTAN